VQSSISKKYGRFSRNLSTLTAFLMLTVYSSWTSSRDLPLEASLLRFEFSRPQMGTLFRIICYAENAALAQRASNTAFARIAKLDDIMSDYSPTSELTLLSQKAGGPPVKVSQDLFDVLSKSQEMARLTNGAFDITVGPLVRLWRRAGRWRDFPDPQRLQQALESVGYSKLRLDSAASSVELLKRGMALDLGGIAKGYAADEALKVLRQFGIDSALVAAGGDIAVSHAPPGSQGWNVGVAPLDGLAVPARRLLLSDAAVSTSGDSEQFVVIGAKRYSHIVNPKTGVGLIGHATVTVVAPDGTTSDSLATALSVLGPNRGLDLIENMEGAAALFIQATEEGIKTSCSRRWKEQ
jgi:thiamine biosynthesis lipoprotein